MTHQGYSAATHRLILVCCLAAMSLAVVLGLVASDEPSNDRLEIGGRRLPSICAFRNTTGLPCPGCGLTRSWVELARGNLSRSVERNRLGWLLMIYVALQAVHHGVWLTLPSARSLIDRAGRWLDRCLIALGLALVISWVVTLHRALAG